MPRASQPINRLPSGAWQVRYRDPEGRQRKASFEKMTEAREFLAKTRVDLKRGAWIDPDDGRTTVKEYAEAWRTAQPWAHGTTESVRSIFANHIYPTIGNVPLERLRPTQCQALINGLTHKLEASTIATVAQHFRALLNAAVADRMIAASPAAKLKLPRVERTDYLIPTVEQVQAIADFIDPRHRALVAVGAGLGLRQGEAFGLTISRIDFLRRNVCIDRQLKREQEGCGLGPLKTENSYRPRLPLPDWVAVELSRHIAEYPSDDRDGLLFLAAMGGRLRRDHWNRRVWKPAVEEAQIPTLTFHGLRHFYASALIQSGHSPIAVADRLGNSPQMVLDTYAHLWPSDEDRTRQALDNLFAPPVADVDDEAAEG